MTTTNPATASYLRHNLMLVQTGQRDRAPGIRRCGDCDTAYIDDPCGLSWCRTCRTAHRRRCAHCHILMPITPDGDRLCACCAQQTELFPTPTTEPGAR